MLAISCIIILFAVVIVLVNLLRKTRREIQDYAEAVVYNDFTRQLSERKFGMKTVGRSLNKITRAIFSLNSQKEVQQQYLQKMLELVDTGILAYDTETNEVLWINEDLENMLAIPGLKNMNWLRKRNEALYHELMEIPLGERRMVTINSGKQTIKVLTNASHFRTGGRTYKMIAFHNVNTVMEEVEAGAWKGLLNVMTHEIMNSVTPVASLAETLKVRIQHIKEKLGVDIYPDFEDIESAMETIHRRSEGLLHFSEVYRNLSRKIVLEKQSVNLYDLISSIYRLMNPSLEQKGVKMEVKTDDFSVVALLDRNLIEQAVINFITNATFAVRERENPNIVLFSGLSSEGNAYITVADNGCGIPDDIRDKIFIPFFSTKKQGSGIGLSLSREIVKLHNANLHIQSKEGEGSAFTILLSV